MIISKQRPNGLRYPRVGGTRQRHFDGTSFEPQKLPENAATPTRRVHAVLARFVSFCHMPHQKNYGNYDSNYKWKND